MKILHVDRNHPALIEGFEALGHENIEAYDTPLEALNPLLEKAEGLVIRSRFPIDKKVLQQAKKLKFIARLGAGLENIDVAYAHQQQVILLAAPEGNRNAVGEHALGLLLALVRKIPAGDQSIRAGQWLREAHRGWELEGKTIGIIGYGNTGQQLAKKLQGFDVTILCHDIVEQKGNAWAEQVPLHQLMQQAELISIHTPETPQTIGMIDQHFINQMAHPFWLINTARGSAVDTQSLLKGLETQKIRGAALDVLEYETKAFSTIFGTPEMPKPLQKLIETENVILSPHIAGWTFESHLKLATVILDKFKAHFHTK